MTLSRYKFARDERQERAKGEAGVVECLAADCRHHYYEPRSISSHRSSHPHSTPKGLGNC